MDHTADMELTAEEIRVLGCLIEKERATPDQYPLTTNALRTACNQKTNRDPVADYEVNEVEQTMLSLRDKGYARSVTGSGRTVKHKQVMDEALRLSNGEVSVLGVLMLRGPQTPNELRTRTERLHGFDSNEAVDATLDELAARDVPLVRCVGKAAGQREARWAQLLSTAEPVSLEPVTREPVTEAVPPPTASAPTGPTIAESASVSAPPPDSSAARIAELENDVDSLQRELSELRDRFDDLAAQLGVS